MIMRVLAVNSGWGLAEIDTDPDEVTGDPRAAAEAEMQLETVVVTAEVRR